MPKKATELPRIMALPTKARPVRDDEVPHWKVWRWSLAHRGVPWKKAA